MYIKIQQTFSTSIIVAILAIATGCSSSNSHDTNSGTNSVVISDQTLTVMAGSEVKDMAPILADLQRETGISIEPTYGGTLEGIDKIETGVATPDAAWFAQDKYFQLVDSKKLIKDSTKIMISPVVLGVKTSVAKSMGWRNGSTTWKDIERAVSAGKFRYAMTSPATSNSGFSAVIGITTAFAGTGNAASIRDVDAKRLTAFFSGQKITSGSSGWLADAYVRDEASVDGIINYESVILDLGKRTKSPLTIIAPKEGTVIADYPLVLLNTKKRVAYDKAVAWLETPVVQRRIMEQTARRPIISSITPDTRFRKGILFDTPFPGSKSTVDAMILAFVNERRIPAHTFYVLDKTGSMKDDDGTGTSRIERVRNAMYLLTGSENSVSGRLTRFGNRETVTIIAFSDVPEIDDTFTMSRTNDTKVFESVRKIADMIEPGGQTAIYTALERAMTESQKDKTGKYQSIVLMTDGENNEGESEDDFIAKYKSQGSKTHIFAIGIGDSKSEELERLTAATGGRYFDARHEDLTSVFREIRGYQ